MGLGDDVIATATLVRLQHRCQVVNIQETSCRMRDYRTKCRVAMSEQGLDEEKTSGVG